MMMLYIIMPVCTRQGLAVDLTTPEPQQHHRIFFNKSYVAL